MDLSENVHTISRLYLFAKDDHRVIVTQCSLSYMYMYIYTCIRVISFSPQKYSLLLYPHVTVRTVTHFLPTADFIMCTVFVTQSTVKLIMVHSSRHSSYSSMTLPLPCSRHRFFSRVFLNNMSH